MIVGGYTLHLYCDFKDESFGHGRPGEFAGETKGHAFRDALRSGWKIDLKAGTALCPNCAKEGRKL